MFADSSARSLNELLVCNRGERERISPSKVVPWGVEGGFRDSSSEEIHEKASRIAGAFSARNARNCRALLALPPGPEFLACFLGCIYAGVIAVPVPEWRGKRGRARIFETARECDATWLIVNGTASRPHPGKDSSLRVVSLLELLVCNDPIHPESLEDDRIAYLQFTSGSMGQPRGVMISHGNVLANLKAMDLRCGAPREGWAVSWLPFHHDMGLINALYSLYAGINLAVETPERFAQRPWRWLETISRFRAFYSGGPNFAYELLNRARQNTVSETIDLSCWTTAFCGSEPIRARTLRRFADRFRAFGFRAEALSPAYGLAEYTLTATAVSPKRLAEVRLVNSDTRDPNTNTPIEIPECGEPLDGNRIRIVDTTDMRPLPEGSVGEIWLSGPSKARGYWGRQEESAEVFQACLGEECGFLRTGDLGFLHSGRLFVVGRTKELIIVRGRNLHAHEIEELVCAAHPSLDETAAAFVVETEEGERLGIACEIRRNCVRNLPTQEVILAIQARLNRRFGRRADDIALVRPRAIPRTTSGKVQRFLCRKELSKGGLVVLARWTPSHEEIRIPESDVHAEIQDPAEIEAWIARWMGTHLGIDSEEINPHIPISSFGLDSFRSMELTAALEDWLGVKLEETLIWSYPTISRLSRSLASRLSSQPDNPPTVNSQPRLFSVESILDQIEALSELEIDEQFPARGLPRSSDHG